MAHDIRFSALFTASTDDAWVWADQPGAADYAPSPRYAHNPWGAVRIQRTAVGRYTVAFDGAPMSGGTVQISPYGHTPAIARVIGWSNGGISVALDTLDGEPVDTRFSLIFVRRPTRAWAWADRAGSGEYQPNPGYAHNPGGGPIHIRRSGVGRYEVQFEGLSIQAGNVQASPYGPTPALVVVEGWGGDRIRLRTFDPAGQPLDTRYTVLYVADRSDAWAWGSQPEDSGYPPSATYANNPGGGAMRIDRAGAGAYGLEVPGLDLRGGNVQVTPYGSAPASARVQGWGGQTIRLVGQPTGAAAMVAPPPAADPPPVAPPEPAPRPAPPPIADQLDPSSRPGLTPGAPPSPIDPTGQAGAGGARPPTPDPPPGPLSEPALVGADHVPGPIDPPAGATWHRLVPMADAEVTEAHLQARIHDPLWMLFRQSQTGEFQGEDAGWPAYAEVRTRAAPITHWSAGGARQPWSANEPLEAATLAETRPLDLRQRAELGRAFLRSLGGVRAVRPPDAPPTLAERIMESPTPDLMLSAGEGASPAARRFARLVGARIPDGAALLDPAGQRLRDQPWATADDTARVEAALAALEARAREDFGWSPSPGPAPTWRAPTLEHTLDVHAADRRLRARPGGRGHLDWWAFDQLEASVEPMPIHETRRFVPTRVTVPGMPGMRWWDFEDSASSLASTLATPQRLARVVVLDYLLIHGQDWFVLPIDVPVGVLLRVDRLVVYDVFGFAHPIASAVDGQGDARWTMFSTSIIDPAGDLPLVRPPVSDALLVAPTHAEAHLDGALLEEAHLIRDEQANLAWAIELTGLDGLGLSVDLARPRPGATPTDRPPSGAAVRYRLRTDVPPNHHPFVAVPLPGAPDQIALQSATLRSATGDRAATPETTLLRSPAGEPLRLREEALPPGGLRVSALHRRARGPDGSTHRWIQRRVGPGARPSPSGLRFDITEPVD